MWMDCRFGLHGIVVVRSCMPQCQAREGSCERYGIGVSHGYIGQVESPKYRTKYNLNHINEIAKFLGCSPRKFLPEEPI